MERKKGIMQGNEEEEKSLLEYVRSFDAYSKTKDLSELSDNDIRIFKKLKKEEKWK